MISPKRPGRKMYLALIFVISSRTLQAAHLRAPPCSSPLPVNEVLPAVDVGETILNGIPIDHLNYVSPNRGQIDGVDGPFQRTYQPSGAIVSPNFEVSSIGSDRLPVPHHNTPDHNLSPPQQSPSSNTPLTAPRQPIIEIMYPSDRRTLPYNSNNLEQRLPRLMTKYIWGEIPQQHEVPSIADQRMNSPNGRLQQELLDSGAAAGGDNAYDNNMGLTLHGDMTVHNDLTTRDYRDAADAESLKLNDAVLPSLSYMPPSPISEDDWDPRPMKPLIKLRKNMMNSQSDPDAESITASTPATAFSDALAEYEIAQRKRWNCLLLIDGVLFSLILAVLLRQR